MKKSKHVPATLVAGVAAAMLAGCSSRMAQERQCVDASGAIVPEIMCRQATSSGVVVGHWGYAGQVYSGGHYISGGGGGVGYRGGGGAISGGVSRGGFGGSGEGFGGGG